MFIGGYRWKKLKVKFDQTLQNMCEKLSEFEIELFMNELDTKNYVVECFEKADIDSF